MPEETIEALSGIQQSITDQANNNQWRKRLNACAKAKGKHFEHLPQYVVDAPSFDSFKRRLNSIDLLQFVVLP